MGCYGDEASIFDCYIKYKGEEAFESCRFFGDKKAGAGCWAPSSTLSPSGCPRTPTSGFDGFVFITCKERKAFDIELSNLISSSSNTDVEALSLPDVFSNSEIKSWGAIDDSYLIVSTAERMALLKKEEQAGGISFTERAQINHGFDQILFHTVTENNIYIIGKKGDANVLVRMAMDNNENLYIDDDVVVTLDDPQGVATANRAIFVVESAHDGELVDIRVMVEVEPGFSLPGLQDVATITPFSKSLSMSVSVTSTTGATSATDASSTKSAIPAANTIPPTGVTSTTVVSLASSGSVAVAIPTDSPAGTPDNLEQGSGSYLLLPGSIITLLLTLAAIALN